MNINKHPFDIQIEKHKAIVKRYLNGEKFLIIKKNSIEEFLFKTCWILTNSQIREKSLLIQQFQLDGYLGYICEDILEEYKVKEI